MIDQIREDFADAKTGSRQRHACVVCLFEHGVGSSSRGSVLPLSLCTSYLFSETQQENGRGMRASQLRVSP